MTNKQPQQYAIGMVGQWQIHLVLPSLHFLWHLVC
jgi:hypothetical protein